MRLPHLGLVVSAHPNEVGFAKAAELRSAAMAWMSRKPWRMTVFEKELTDVHLADEAAALLRQAEIDGLVFMMATWSDDSPAVRLALKLDVPCLTWAIRGIETGSLCGTQQLGMVLGELGVPFVFHLGDIDDPSSAGALADFAATCATSRDLHELRVGELGHRTAGMTEIALDEMGLRRALGVEVVPLSMWRFVQGIKQVDDTEARATWEMLRSEAARIDCTEADGLRAAAFLLSLRKLIVTHKLGGVAVDCYPDLMGRFCLAASVLAGEGVVIGCEGDVNGTVAQWILQQLTGQPVHNTDLLDFDPRTNIALLSHCGNGHMSLSTGSRHVHFAPARLANDGLCVLFPGRTGPVTMVNLVGNAASYRLAVIEAEAVPAEMAFPGNPVRVALPHHENNFLCFVSEHALGHHWMIGYGHVATRVRLLSRFVGMRLLEMT